MFNQKVIRLLQAFGGKAYVVGGAVRDSLLGLPNKDLDIEVYMGIDQVKAIAEQIGPISLVGISFGVVKLKHPELGEIDLTLPRRENSTGAGYKDFEVVADPTLSPYEAASRRDFTINTIMWGLEGIVDPHGGVKDLRERVLRHVSEKFSEDPLRVLRGFQFCSRFGLSAHPETITLSRHLSSAFHTLSKERLYAEWQKWAKGKEPQKGLLFLHQTGWDSLFGLDVTPTLSVLKSVPPALQAYQPDDKLVILLAVVCSVCGANPGDVVAHINAPKAVGNKLVALVDALNHPPTEVTHSFVNHLSVKLKPATVNMYTVALSFIERELAGEVRRVAEELGVIDQAPKPILTGAHLLKLGWKPGPIFKKTLEASYEAQLNCVFKDEAGALAWLEK